MNIHVLREAQVRYENRKQELITYREDLFKVRDSFTKYFDLQRIEKMQINEYVIGFGSPEKGFNFCYGLERQLVGLGNIKGATSLKFGIYYGKKSSNKNLEYRFVQKFGNTYIEAFDFVKTAILQLLDAGKKEDINLIVKNPLSPMFKGKILSTYFPERYLNIFSEDHLNYFLTQLNIDTTELIKRDVIFKREALIAFKNSDPVMQEWTVDSFATFLYLEYPGRPRLHENKEIKEDLLADYRNHIFPYNQNPKFIDLEELPPILAENGHNFQHAPKIDYEREARINSLLGERGEKIVVELEKQRLISVGKNDLAKKVERVSTKSDSFGYDILSFDENGRERLIEVKATKSQVGCANFYLKSNELMVAQKSENYYIYMVYDVTSESPKVWKIYNPFKKEYKNAIITPIKYKVAINAK